MLLGDIMTMVLWVGLTIIVAVSLYKAIIDTNKERKEKNIGKTEKRD